MTPSLRHVQPKIFALCVQVQYYSSKYVLLHALRRTNNERADKYHIIICVLALKRRWIRLVQYLYYLKQSILVMGAKSDCASLSLLVLS